MANKGKSRHMASLAAPKYFAVRRKEHYYIAKPNPGRHTLERSIPVLLALKKLGVAGTKSEASKIFREGKVRVNGKRIMEMKFPVGLNDVIEVQGVHPAHMITIDNLAKVKFDPVEKPNHDSQLYRVIGKYMARKGQVMIRLHDGSIAKASNDVRVNDSVVIDSKRNVKKVLNMGAGAECFIVSGVHVGAAGRIKSIKEGTEKREASAVIAPKSGEEFETIIRNIMVVG